jgi:hypothetical protein
MHAVSAIPTSATRAPRPPRRRGLGAMARQVAVDLTPQAVEQVATRVAQLLHRQQQAHDQEQTQEKLGLLTVAKLAKHLDLNPAYIYEHADELEAIRIGDGPKARIRFDLHTAEAALKKLQATREPAPPETAGRKRRQPVERGSYTPDAPLLEIRRLDARGIRSAVPRHHGRLTLI